MIGAYHYDAVPPQFTGKERDSESGNDYAKARFYVNRFGRFSSVDPLSGGVSDPQSLNRYSYSVDDPIDFSNPLGSCYVSNLNVDCSDNNFYSTQAGFSCFSDGAPAPCEMVQRMLANGTSFNCPLVDCSGVTADVGTLGIIKLLKWIPQQVTYEPTGNPAYPYEIHVRSFWKVIGLTYPYTGGNTSGLSDNPGGTVRGAPKLKFKPPSWRNFTHEFLPCYQGELYNNLMGNDDRALVTVATIALTVVRPPIGAPLLALWTGVNAFKAGAACAYSSRAEYE